MSNKRAKQTQRRILKGFNINTVESALEEAFTNAKNDGEKSKDFFKVVAKAIGNKDRSKCLFCKSCSVANLQCENSKIILPLVFYVKSKFHDLVIQKCYFDKSRYPEI